MTRRSDRAGAALLCALTLGCRDEPLLPLEGAYDVDPISELSSWEGEVPWYGLEIVALEVAEVGETAFALIGTPADGEAERLDCVLAQAGREAFAGSFACVAEEGALQIQVAGQWETETRAYSNWSVLEVESGDTERFISRSAVLTHAE